MVVVLGTLFASHSDNIIVEAEPLTSEAFAFYGDVITNPRPDTQPKDIDLKDIEAGKLPFGAVSTSGGRCVQYAAISSIQNLYNAGQPRLMLSAFSPQYESPISMEAIGDSGMEVPLPILERHPFTNQTFIPLSGDTSMRYLVVVAPSLAKWDENFEHASYPDQESQQKQAEFNKPLPSEGGPDSGKIRAFLATMDQGVTYAAGTWHSPMIVMGSEDTTATFVVVQYANGVPLDDCQQIALRGVDDKDSEGFSVRIRAQSGSL